MTCANCCTAAAWHSPSPPTHHRSTLIWSGAAWSDACRLSQIAKDSGFEQQCVGLHFFNPERNVTPIVEVIHAPSTSREHVAAVSQFAIAVCVLFMPCMSTSARQIGKTPVLVAAGSTGFVLNRMLSQWLSEAMFLLVDGVW